VVGVCSEDEKGEAGLRSRVFTALSELGFDRKQIHHMALGASCRTELTLYRRLVDVQIHRQELADFEKIRTERGKPAQTPRAREIAARFEPYHEGLSVLGRALHRAA
jgi:hypothetical protein